MKKNNSLNPLFNNLTPLFQNIQENEAPGDVDYEKEDVTIDPKVAIEALERRVFELEVENSQLRDKDNRPWCFDSRQPAWVRYGITRDQFQELEKIGRHFVTKSQSNPSVIMANCWSSPIPTREKLILFLICLSFSNPNQM